MLTPSSAIALLILMNLFWAGSYTVMKYGLQSIDALALVFWRLLIGVILLGLWIIIRRIPLELDRSDIQRIVLAGLCFTASSALVVIGVELSHATEASLLYTFEPVWGIILASIVLKERLLPTTIMGLILVLAGLAALSGFDPQTFFSVSGNHAGLGNILLVIGLLGESLFTIILKPVAEKRNAAVIFSGVLLVALVILLIPVSVRGGLSLPIAGPTVFSISYLAIICTAAGYTLWIATMKCVPVSILIFTVFIQPISGMLIAAAALGEPIDQGILIGGSLLLTGTAIAIFGHLQKSSALGEADPDKVSSCIPS